jgi:hypothetical protein
VRWVSGKAELSRRNVISGYQLKRRSLHHYSFADWSNRLQLCDKGAHVCPVSLIPHNAVPRENNQTHLSNSDLIPISESAAYLYIEGIYMYSAHPCAGCASLGRLESIDIARSPAGLLDARERGFWSSVIAVVRRRGPGNRETLQPVASSTYAS